MDQERNDLLHALENETNSSIMNLTTAKIKEHKNTILQQLQLEKSKLKTMHNKLTEYRYCTDMSDIQYGYYIRWIPLKDPENLYLTNGGIICDMKIVNNQIQIICKNYRNRFWQFKFDEAVIFQKISPQERVILSVLDYLNT
ncbi:MAG: hypothetical protein CXT73_05040 [Methanobacteriota archaeon]|nr:MAG: hypothetical protein CXT73_05040 [Euryarchaeota archaeon]